MNSQEKQEETVISLVDILNILKNNLTRIILWGILGVVLSLIISFVMMTPKYSSTVDILVNQKTDNQQAQYTAQQADLQAINTYKDVLKKSVILSPVLKQVRQKDNYQGSLGDLQNSVDISNETNSQVLSITVKDANAYTAADIADTIGSVFTKKIKTMMKVDNVTVVSAAKVNTSPVSPNKKLNALAGLVIGVLIGVAIAVIRELLDKTVKNEQFLSDDLQLVNLGSVYHLDVNEDSYGIVRVISKNLDGNAGNEGLSRRRV